MHHQGHPSLVWSGRCWSEYKGHPVGLPSPCVSDDDVDEQQVSSQNSKPTLKEGKGPSKNGSEPMSHNLLKTPKAQALASVGIYTLPIAFSACRPGGEGFPVTLKASFICCSCHSLDADKPHIQSRPPIPALVDRLFPDMFFPAPSTKPPRFTPPSP